MPRGNKTNKDNVLFPYNLKMQYEHCCCKGGIRTPEPKWDRIYSAAPLTTRQPYSFVGGGESNPTAEATNLQSAGLTTCPVSPQEFQHVKELFNNFNVIQIYNIEIVMSIIYDIFFIKKTGFFKEPGLYFCKLLYLTLIEHIYNRVCIRRC